MEKNDLNILMNDMNRFIIKMRILEFRCCLSLERFVIIKFRLVMGYFF